MQLIVITKHKGMEDKVFYKASIPGTIVHGIGTSPQYAIGNLFVHDSESTGKIYGVKIDYQLSGENEN